MAEFGMHEAKTLTPVEPVADRSALFGCMAGEIEFLEGYDELPDEIAEAFDAR